MGRDSDVLNFMTPTLRACAALAMCSSGLLRSKRAIHMVPYLTRLMRYEQLISAIVATWWTTISVFSTVPMLTCEEGTYGRFFGAKWSMQDGQTNLLHRNLKGLGFILPPCPAFHRDSTGT